MSDLLIYLIKANVALSLFYLAYILWLQKLTFFKTNRFYLLFSLIFSAVYPFINLNDLFTANQAIDPHIVILSPDWQLIQFTKENHGVDGIYEVLFWISVGLFALRLIIKLTGLLKVHLKSIPAQWSVYSYRATIEISSPFSFWKNIYLNPFNHSADEYEKIFKHEYVHVSQLHTLDILISEIAILIFWYNPFCWLIRHAVMENLEFITDQKVISSGIDKQSYQFSLVNFSTLLPKQSILGNHFNLKNLKKRIIMMNKKETTKRHIGKYVFIIPALVFGSFIFSVSKAYEKPVESKQFRPILSEVFQDTGKFHNLDSLEFYLQNSNASSFGRVTNEDALILLDDEKISKKQMNSINPEYIKEICVFKGEEAIKLYGDAGKHGVILITTRRSKEKQRNADKESESGSVNKFSKNPGVNKPHQPADLKTSQETLNNTPISQNLKIRKAKSTATLNQEENPLFLLDGVRISEKEMKKLRPEDIKSISVLKDEQAVQMYGEEGRDGVILITTKTLEEQREQDETVSDPIPENALFILNGEKIDKDKFDKVSPNEIKKMEVLKGEKAVEAYGEDGRKGVIILTTK